MPALLLPFDGFVTVELDDGLETMFVDEDAEEDDDDEDDDEEDDDDEEEVDVDLYCATC